VHDQEVSLLRSTRDTELASAMSKTTQELSRVRTRAAEDLNVLKKQLTSPATLLERKQLGGR